MMGEVRNPVRLPDGRIDCEVLHPVLGWIPYTANENDPNANGRVIFVIALALFRSGAGLRGTRAVDQSSVVGITGTMAQFNAALSDNPGFQFFGDPPTIHLHAQEDISGLVTDLNDKQATLISGATIKTFGGVTLLGAGDIPLPSGGGISDGDKGDITVSVGGTVWAVDAGAITLAKQADMATGSLVYRKTAGAGAPEVQTLATLKTDLGLTGANTGDETAAGILAKLLTVDGPASGLDADLLDGMSSAAFATAAQGALAGTASQPGHTHAQGDVTGLVVALAGKQDALISGTTIKTVNDESLLGAGNVVIAGGGSGGASPIISWAI